MFSRAEAMRASAFLRLNRDDILAMFVDKSIQRPEARGGRCRDEWNVPLLGRYDGRPLAGIEQAKGILMARNGIDADDAYELLKSQSQHSGRKLVEIAQALTESHQLLPTKPPT